MINHYSADELDEDGGLTPEGGGQGDGEDEQGAHRVHDAQVLDQHETDDVLLDVAVADVEDDADVGGDGDGEDDEDERALGGLGEVEDVSGGPWGVMVRVRVRALGGQDQGQGQGPGGHGYRLPSWQSLISWSRGLLVSNGAAGPPAAPLPQHRVHHSNASLDGSHCTLGKSLQGTSPKKYHKILV